MAEDDAKTKMQDRILATIDELRAKIDALTNQAFGQDEDGDKKPEERSVDNIDNLIRSTPPGLLTDWIKRMAQDPDTVRKMTPKDEDTAPVVEN